MQAILKITSYIPTGLDVKKRMFVAVLVLEKADLYGCPSLKGKVEQTCTPQDTEEDARKIGMLHAAKKGWDVKTV